MYDLAADPGETHDVAGARPFVAGYLAQLTRAARREQETVRIRLAAGATQDLSAAEREELRALGYIR
jgi:phospholipase/lecithinase/hemolysin